MKLIFGSISFFYKSTAIIQYPTMKRKLYILLFSILCIGSSCQEKPQQNQIEDVAASFCTAFYNYNYPEAKEWVTSTSLPYLSFLASNIQQSQLEQLKVQEPANISIIASQIEPDTKSATVICEIKNALIINPFNGQMEQVATLTDTLHLMKEKNNWLVRKGIQQQNEKQSPD